MSIWNKNVATFLGCDSEYDAASTVIFGAPFDGTTSYRPGTRFAGKSMRGESYSLETYSPYQDRDITDYPIFDGGELDLPFGNPRQVLDIIRDQVQAIIADRKFPLMIGGEHLVTLGAVEAALAAWPDLHIIQFDAHADLRDDYLGEKLSHATVMRRCWDLVGDGKIFQFGIRSGEREEFIWAGKHVVTRRFDFSGLEQYVRQIKDKPVYLTIDLDILDPSVFPGTGTPEAGGVDFPGLLAAIRTVCAGNVVACDLCELAPTIDPGGISTVMALKVLRELLLAIQK